MFNTKNKKPNLIRTKLLLLIAKEQIKTKKEQNLLKLNSKSFKEIDEQYETKNFKIKMHKKIINGGKNLCISYSSKFQPRHLNNENEKKNKIIYDFEIDNNLEEIKLNAKRKVSQIKLGNIENFYQKKKNFNIEKEKLLEKQKKNFIKLRKIANLFKNYSIVKRKKMKRLKSVSINESDIEKKLNKTKKKIIYNKHLHYSSKGIPEIKNSSLFGRNSFKRDSKKKKSAKQNKKIITDIIDYDNENDSKSTKFSNTIMNYENIFYQKEEYENEFEHIIFIHDDKNIY